MRRLRQTKPRHGPPTRAVSNKAGMAAFGLMAVIIGQREPARKQTLNAVRNSRIPHQSAAQVLSADCPVQIPGANVRYPPATSGKRTGSKPPNPAAQPSTQCAASQHTVQRWRNLPEPSPLPTPTQKVLLPFVLPPAALHAADRLITALMTLVRAVADIATSSTPACPDHAAQTLFVRLSRLVTTLIRISAFGIRTRAEPKPTNPARAHPAPIARPTRPGPTQSLPRRPGWLLAALPDVAPAVATDLDASSSPTRPSPPSSLPPPPYTAPCVPSSSASASPRSHPLRLPTPHHPAPHHFAPGSPAPPHAGRQPVPAAPRKATPCRSKLPRRDGPSQPMPFHALIIPLSEQT